MQIDYLTMLLPSEHNLSERIIVCVAGAFVIRKYSRLPWNALVIFCN